MGKPLNFLIDLILTIVLGTVGLTVLIAAIVSIPYVIGKAMLHLPIGISTDRQELELWRIGLSGIVVVGLIWLIGTAIRRIILGL